MSIFYYACYALSYIYPAGGMPTYGQSVMVICLSACMNSWFMNNGKQGKIESNHSAYLYDFYSLIFHKKNCHNLCEICFCQTFGEQRKRKAFPWSCSQVLRLVILKE